jgi:hypothetical protein
MTQIRIDEISGGTFPIDVFVSDAYGNNQALIGVITLGPVPPPIRFNSTIPSIYDTAPEVYVTLVDNLGCERTEVLICTFGCAFEIIIETIT